ncbi:MAG: ribosomal protein S10, small subunit ribosomal protein S10 [Parcubacteria group bacterium GW2011_GWC1_41_7]|nr:MAG: ribosomal protein S10, small subunit ribosomal protein S10 [Parcubacteria group bacterium GW2011_GWC1_41_7]
MAQTKTQSKLRIRLKSYDHRLVDKYAKQLIDLLAKEEVQIKGPIPLPTEIKRYTVNRATHVYNDSREQFEIRMHKRLIDVVNPTQRVLEIFSSLDLPSGIEIEIKTF